MIVVFQDRGAPLSGPIAAQKSCFDLPLWQFEKRLPLCIIYNSYKIIISRLGPAPAVPFFSLPGIASPERLTVFQKLAPITAQTVPAPTEKEGGPMLPRKAPRCKLGRIVRAPGFMRSSARN